MPSISFCSCGFSIYQTSGSGGGGGNVPDTRLINTTAPLTGGGDLSADLTLGVNDFTNIARGTVPASGGGTTNFLRADGSWQATPGGVPTSRTINTTAPMTGGGDLTADRTFAVDEFAGVGVPGYVPDPTGLPGDEESYFLNAEGNWILVDFVSADREVNTSAPLQGGGSLAANLSLTIDDFDGTDDGYVVANPAPSGLFLRDDGTWAAAGGGGGGVMTWSIGTSVSMLTTQLNNLGDNTGSALGTEFDNTPVTGDQDGGFLFADFILTAGTGLATTANSSYDLYLIPATDGSVYNDGSSTVRPPNFFKGAFVIPAGTAFVLTIQGIPIPPCPFKLTLYNNGTSRPLNATDNTVFMVPYAYQLV